MKKTILFVFGLFVISALNANVCQFEAKHGEAGTWTEGSCYGMTGDCIGKYPGCEEEDD
jgi:hypothetical protein